MHHNTESLQTLLARPRKNGPTNPATIEDTGECFCRVCDHKRAMVDGEKICMLCCMYIFLKDAPEE